VLVYPGGQGTILVGLGSYPASAKPGRHGTIYTTITGNKQLLADRSIRGLLLAHWLPTWFVTGAESLLVSYVAVRGQPEGAASRPLASASILLAGLPIGMLLGNLLVGRFCSHGNRTRHQSPRLASKSLSSGSIPRPA
jgi:hypothetical protein